MGIELTLRYGGIFVNRDFLSNINANTNIKFNNMKKRNLASLLVGLAIVLGTLITSCSKDPDAPTLNFTAVVDGYVVTITANATDATSWDWNYGDGNTATTVGSHTYTYAQSGDYTITCTVTGDGGEATSSVDVTIESSLEELISGGPDAANGKTWVVSKLYTTGDGVGSVNNVLELDVMAFFPDNILELFGLGAEYDDEFTFFSDGKYVMNPVNGQVVASMIQGVVTQTITVPSTDPNSLPLCAATYTPPVNGTWALSTADYSMEAFADPTIVPDAEPYDVTFTFPTANKINKFDLSAGQFLGILDAFGGQQASVTLLESVTADKMQIVVMIATDAPYFYLPTLAFHISLVPKN